MAASFNSDPNLGGLADIPNGDIECLETLARDLASKGSVEIRRRYGYQAVCDIDEETYEVLFETIRPESEPDQKPKAMVTIGPLFEDTSAIIPTMAYEFSPDDELDDDPFEEDQVPQMLDVLQGLIDEEEIPEDGRRLLRHLQDLLFTRITGGYGDWFFLEADGKGMSTGDAIREFIEQNTDYHLRVQSGDSQMTRKSLISATAVRVVGTTPEEVDLCAVMAIEVSYIDLYRHVNCEYKRSLGGRLEFTVDEAPYDLGDDETDYFETPLLDQDSDPEDTPSLGEGSPSIIIRFLTDQLLQADFHDSLPQILDTASEN